MGINPEIIKEYLERKQKQIISVSNNITNKLEQTNNLEYEEIEKIFSDDSEFLSTIQNEKENTFNDSLQSNTKLSLLKSLKSNINNLKTSLETTNSIDNKQINNSLEDITEEYRKDIEQELPSRLDYRYRVYHADFSRISPVKNSINDVYTGVKNIKKDKILLTELIANEKNINKKTYSQYKKIKKQLPFLLRYYGTALTASSKVNSLVDAASNYVGSMDKLKEFNYNLGDVIEDLEL
ncbi:MAG: hypothetical protein LBH96_04365 [Candidatus Peribacteria bacterium]|nr:hypothetical protein [Candidatus Peribacteria bacterium]